MCRRGALVWCLSVMAGLSACTQLEDGNSGQCVPECGPNLRCIEGQCQPILCTESSECILGQICHEGRCAASCDGETHCPSATCEEGLCVGTRECASGDVRDCMTACGAGIERCTNSMWSLCSAGVPSARDACGDGVDGDCDGEVDEACPACQPDERQPCENDCGSGVQVCEEGVWSLCSLHRPMALGNAPVWPRPPKSVIRPVVGDAGSATMEFLVNVSSMERSASARRGIQRPAIRPAA